MKLKNKKTASIVIAAIFFVVAFIFRVMDTPDIVFVEDRVELLGVDSYFYLRHAEYTHKHYPQLLKNDFETHYPNGGYADAAGLYPLFLASLSKIGSMFSEDSQLTAKISSWMSPLFGALSVLLVFLIGRVVSNLNAGILAALAYMLFPGTALNRAAFGFVDHHILEVVLALAIILSFFSVYRQSKVHFTRSALGGGLFTLLFMIWAGAPLYFIIIGGASGLLYLLSCFHEQFARHQAINLSAYFLGALIFYVVFNIIWSDLFVVSGQLNLKRNITGLVGLAVMPLGFRLVWNEGKKRIKNAKLLFAIIISGLLIGTYLFMAFTNIGKVIDFWLNFRYAGLVENRAVTHQYFLDRFGQYGYLSLVGAVLLVVSAFLKSSFVFYSLIAFFTLFLSYFWYNTYDLDYMPAAFYGLSFGLLVNMIIERFLPRFKKLDKPFVVFLFGPALILMLFTIARLTIPNLTKPYLTNAYISQAKIYPKAWFSATDWLRENTPPPAIDIASILNQKAGSIAYPPGAYGIICPWDYGNLVNQNGRRFPVWSRWPKPVATDWMFSQSEEESLNNLCESCADGEQIKYAIVNAKVAGSWFNSKMILGGLKPQAWYETRTFNLPEGKKSYYVFNDKHDNSTFLRLYKFNGQGMQHYRWVYASPEEAWIGEIGKPNRSFASEMLLSTPEVEKQYRNILSQGITKSNLGLIYQQYITSQVKIFEVVKGVRLFTSFQNATRAKLTLPMMHEPSGRTFNYMQDGVRITSGDIRFIVPYSSQPMKGCDFQATGPFIIEMYNEANQQILRKQFAVPEAAVHTGDTFSINF